MRSYAAGKRVTGKVRGKVATQAQVLETVVLWPEDFWEKIAGKVCRLEFTKGKLCLDFEPEIAFRRELVLRLGLKVSC